MPSGRKGAGPVRGEDCLRYRLRIRCHFWSTPPFVATPQKENIMKKFSVKALTLTAMLTAVSIILSRLLGFYLTEGMRVSFEYFTIVLAGVCLGPVAGALVGGLSDFLGATVLSGLGFFPPLTIGPILAGALAGILGKYMLRGDAGKWGRVMVIVIISELVGNLIWGTFALSLLYETPFWTLLIVRTPIKLAIMVVDAQLVYGAHRALGPMLRSSGMA